MPVHLSSWTAASSLWILPCSLSQPLCILCTTSLLALSYQEPSLTDGAPVRSRNSDQRLTSVLIFRTPLILGLRSETLCIVAFQSCIGRPLPERVKETGLECLCNILSGFLGNIGSSLSAPRRNWVGLSSFYLLLHWNP